MPKQCIDPVEASVTIGRLSDSPGSGPGRWRLRERPPGVACLRVASDSHFATNVLVGTLIGCSVGLTLPLCHIEAREAKSAALEAEGWSSISFRAVPKGITL